MAYRYDWYDSNYGSSYTARKEEHVSRILGTSYDYDGQLENTGPFTQGREWGREGDGGHEGQLEEQRGAQDERSFAQQRIVLRPSQKLDITRH